MLISAPTGSGKTLAAFLSCLDRLVRAALDGSLRDETQVVYVSPLKALSNDIQKNLERPLSEIAKLAGEKGLLMPPIRVAVRTGDTPMCGTAANGQAAAAHSGHDAGIALHPADGRAQPCILENHATRSSSMKSTRWWTTSAARTSRCRSPGSTIWSPRPAARSLNASGCRRPCDPSKKSRSLFGPSNPIRIIDSGHRRKMDLAVEVPKDELGAVASNEMWGEIYDRLAELILEHRTTLVFVNTRRLAERVSHHLAERLGETAVLAHHGSLSRRLRLEAEQKLKNGELRAVVATASLELGIDIGSVDLVCQIGSPRSIAVALQRIGRSGHRVDPHSVPKGRLFATTRDELIECAALVHAIRAGALDALEIPPWPLDVLAQQIVSAAACEAWTEDDLFELVRQAYPYRDLPRARLRCRDRNALGRHRDATRPQRRVSASRSDQRHRARPARRAACGDHVGRRNSRKRELLCRRRTRRNDRRHTGRRLRSRKPGRRRFPAGHDVVADPPRRVRTRPRRRCARRGAVDSLLARRSAGPHGRTLRRSCAISGRRSRSRRTPSTG